MQAFQYSICLRILNRGWLALNTICLAEVFEMQLKQPVTLAGPIRETLFHAPATMLYHWNMIEPRDVQIHRELMMMPLLFTSYDNYL